MLHDPEVVVANMVRLAQDGDAAAGKKKRSKASEPAASKPSGKIAGKPLAKRKPR